MNGLLLFSSSSFDGRFILYTAYGIFISLVFIMFIIYIRNGHRKQQEQTLTTKQEVRKDFKHIHFTQIFASIFISICILCHSHNNFKL